MEAATIPTPAGEPKAPGPCPTVPTPQELGNL